MANPVILYSTPTCVYCKMAKEYFAKNGVAFTEHNVAEDDKAREEMVNKSRQFGVPVIDINGKIIVGFNRMAVAKALNLAP
ncbi:MAG: glutaredoxin family protein [Patescibacteria group bacterium]